MEKEKEPLIPTDNLISYKSFMKKFGMTPGQMRNLFDKGILTKYIIGQKIIMVDVNEFIRGVKVKGK